MKVNNLSVKCRMIRQPVMVDGPAFRCKGTTDEVTLIIAPFKVSHSFYVVRGLIYGILAADIPSTFKGLN